MNRKSGAIGSPVKPFRWENSAVARSTSSAGSAMSAETDAECGEPGGRSRHSRTMFA